MSTDPTPAPLRAPTAGARRVVSGLLAVIALCTTAAVAIAVDRSLGGRGAQREAHDHGEEGHAEPGHGDEPHRAEGHADEDHGHETHGATHGDGTHAEGTAARDALEHAPHVDVATVTLSDAQRATAKLVMSTAGPGTVDEVMKLPGEVALDADRVAHVTPRTEGAVREVRADLGADVKKGDVLAVLESREVAAMQQELMAARARRELAEASFRRVEPLYRDGITSEKEFLATKQALAEARIDEASAAQKLAAGAGPRATATGLSLVAPLDGRIVAKHITIGEVLASDVEAFTIADLSRLWVWSTAHARELTRLRKGQRAYVRADGIEQPLLGHVDYVESMLGERTRTARARIVVDDPPEGWRPGMFVTAELVVAEVQAAVVIRDEAVQRLGEHPVVFVEADGRFEARPVELGRAGRDAEGRLMRAIDVGLRAGEPYVAENAFLLKAELGKGSAGHEH